MPENNGTKIREDVAVLRTDIEWIKEMLQRLDEKLDKRDEEWKKMFQDIREETDGRFHDLEKKVGRLEAELNSVKRQLAKLWGAIGSISIIAAILEILHLVGAIP